MSWPTWVESRPEKLLAESALICVALSTAMWEVSSAASWVEVSAETCWVESCVSWVTSKTTEVANFGICVAVSALTWVVESAAT